MTRAVLALVLLASCGHDKPATPPRKCCRDTIIKSVAGATCPDDRQYLQPHPGGLCVCRCAGDADERCVP